MRRRRPLTAHDLGWVSAFLLACLVLVGVRSALHPAPHDAAAPAVPRRAHPTIAVPPADSPLGRIWHTPPRAPTSFADPASVPPAPVVARALDAAPSLAGWPQIGNQVRLENAIGLVRACDTVDQLTPLCVATPGPDPHKVALLVGDDTMQAYWMMLRPIFVAHGWTVVNDALTGCPSALVDAGTPADCAKHHRSFERVLARWRPSLVVMSDSENTPTGLASYAAGLARAIELARGHHAHVLLMSPPPAQPSVTSCQQDHRTPAECARTPYRTWFALNRTHRAVAARTGATYADLLPLFCARLVCPSVVPGDGGTIAVRGDYVHLTPEYAQFVAASFDRYLVRTGLIG